MKPAVCKTILSVSSLFLCLALSAQHCPWDCSGMILLNTKLDKEHFYKLGAVLVDDHKNVISDTLYGTGAKTYDTCRFLSCDDFIAYRTGRTNFHHWYAYDTLYHFAEGMFIVKFNFCKYEGRELFIRFSASAGDNAAYRYISVAQEQRVHLHNYSTELFDGNSTAIRKKIRPQLIAFP